MAHLNLSVPDEPPTDHVVYSILITYSLLCRGRRYTEGQPLPMSVKDVTSVIYAHPVDIPRSMLDPIIFAIDDIVLANHRATNDTQDNDD